MIIQVPARHTNIKLDKLKSKLKKIKEIKGVYPGYNNLEKAPALLIHGQNGWNLFLNLESSEEEQAIAVEYIVLNKKAISLLLKDAGLYDIYFQIKES